VNNSCQSAAKCGNGTCEAGESQTNCCTDCGCPAGLACENNSCQQIIECGDGICEPGESQATCCEDCGCPAGLACENNSCQPTAVCGNGICEPGESETNCCLDCGCPVDFTCESNVCEPEPVCGNGVCEPGESQASCCEDCGCQGSGWACQTSGGGCTFEGTSTFSWTFTNQCLDGENIQFKVFDQNAKLVWPTPPNVYLSSPGATNTDAFLCTIGNKICFGGDQPQHNLSWGIGINGTQACSNCCYVCANASGSTNFTCP
jgi:hypothetical protein